MFGVFSHLGASGDLSNDLCVGDPWTRDKYTTDSLCYADEEEGQCCLKRYHSDTTTLVTLQEISEVVLLNKSMSLYKPFIVAMVGWMCSSSLPESLLCKSAMISQILKIKLVYFACKPRK